MPDNPTHVQREVVHPADDHTTNTTLTTEKNYPVENRFCR
jgi:hypothetical protein